MSERQASPGLFERTFVFPDVEAKERFAALVGIDDQKTRLTRILGILLNPTGLEKWANKHHAAARDLVKTVTRRPPLVVLSGDVGSGKTELAETVCDAVARQERLELTLLPLSLSARGQGRVGEMTQLLSAAFDQLSEFASKLKANHGKHHGGAVLLVDEADALAESRESAQMHHEDRAGVNAFIRGIDRIAAARLPAAVIMCTNRFRSLDPAVRRRSAEILVFERPGENERRALLTRALDGLAFSESDIAALVAATGSTERVDHGFTFSDITQRLLPAIVLDAYPDKAIRAERAIEIATMMSATTPFKDA